jgi:hypothetical protein
MWITFVGRRISKEIVEKKIFYSILFGLGENIFFVHLLQQSR